MQVFPVCDARGTFPQPLEAAFPDSGLTGAWSLHVHCFLLRMGALTMLVDAGTGPAWAPATRWFGRPGRLIEGLAELGVGPTDVTHVVLTHLHLDHVGWVVHGSADDPEPTFANARHLVQRSDLDPGRLGGLYATHVLPLLAAGMLDAVDGGAEPVPGVRLLPTPGHTAGHQSVSVERAGEHLIISGDAFVHAAQVVDPGLLYAHEDDPTQAASTRRELLRMVGDRPTVLAPAHFDDTLAMIDIDADGTATLRSRERCDRSD